jgi:hypothetical protein
MESRLIEASGIYSQFALLIHSSLSALYAVTLLLHRSLRYFGTTVWARFAKNLAVKRSAALYSLGPFKS